MDFGESGDVRVGDLYGVGKQQPFDGFGARRSTISATPTASVPEV
jgi:hypothetical protein